MNAYRIRNDIVAAMDSQAAIAAWADHYHCAANEAGPVEEVNPSEVPCQAENHEGDGSVDPSVKTVADVMPPDGPAEIVCIGECEGCN